MKIRSSAFGFAVLAFALQGARGADSGEFGVTFADYAVGESLSAKGATGGSWGAIDAGITATNISFQSTNVIDVRAADETRKLTFANTVGIPAHRSKYDFRAAFKGADSIDGQIVDPAACGFTMAKLDGERYALAGAASGAWHLLSAPDFVARLDELYDLRMETCSIGEAAYVSYLVKMGSDYVRLSDARGATWFAIPRAAADKFSKVEFAGCGLVSDFSGGEGDAEPKTAYHWIGAATGDWTDAANWSVSAGGASCGRVPGVGDYVRVDGKVRLSCGEETALVSNFVSQITGADAQELLAGAIETPVSLMVRRPRVGHALALESAPFCGLTPSAPGAWYRGTPAKDYATAPCALANAYTFEAADCEHWFKVVVNGLEGKLLEQEFYFSKLPVFYLTTDDGKTPTSKKEEHDGRLTVQCGETQWDDDSLYSGKMTIKVRGNSTSGYPKKPWKLKLKDKTKMFGIPKSKHWVLLANYNDKSNMRNKLAYDFANEIGNLGMKSTWVECVLNGEWQGCYQFCEHVRVDKNRVNVFDWEGESEDRGHLAEDLSWVDPATEDITGGYLFEASDEYDEISKFTVTSGKLTLKTMVNTPEHLVSNATMMAWCQDYIQKFCDATTSVDGYSPEGLHWSEYCDTDSMATYFLVMEMFGNNDASYKSRYFYKDRGKKMVFGPVWDFDWGVGNGVVSSTTATGWKVQGNVASFYREWADDPWFCTRLWTIYHKKARAAFAAQMAKGGVMDDYRDLLLEAGAADDGKWLNDKWLKPKEQGGYGRPYRTFADDVELLRTYLTDRLAWLDEKFADVPTLMASLKTSGSTSPYAPDATSLPIAFANAPAGVIREGQALRLSFAVGDASVAKTDVFADGLCVRRNLAVENGRFDAIIPAAALTATKGDPNCVSFVAYDADGTLKARNYALVTITDYTDADATPEVRDGGKTVVPSVPHRWIVEQAATVPGAEALLSATAAEYADAVRQVPSPWGKATPLWRDYVAGTNPDPNGPDAEFRITSFAIGADGTPSVTYRPDKGGARRYTVEGRAELTTGEWKSPAPVDAKFFRVKVELPNK